MGRKDNSYVFDKFEYHLEDLDCSNCLHGGKCNRRTCRYEDIRQEAIKKGRIKRPKNWYGRYGEKWRD